MFAFMCSMGLWKTRSAIGAKASGRSLTKPRWLSQHDQPTTLHTLDRIWRGVDPLGQGHCADSI